VAEPSIRLARPTDLDRLYEICLRTGAAGEDATTLMEDHRLLGELFVAPYAVLEPEHALVLDDGTGTAGGYVVGALDTAAFEARCEGEWWPAIRARYPAPTGRGGLEDLFIGYLHGKAPTDPALLERYPSHLHIDLLPAFQSGGWGRRMMAALCDTLRADGSRGLHLGMSAANTRAIGFYEHLGFTLLRADDVTRTYGIDL
jgi:ribosomal protein S18 acetylase RimI-like enzyme